MARRIHFAPVLGVLGLVAFLSWGSASAQTEPGLVAAWGLDEGRGTIAGDRSGNGRAGTIAGASWTTEGRFGSGLVFNGTTSYVRGQRASVVVCEVVGEAGAHCFPVLGVNRPKGSLVVALDVGLRRRGRDVHGRRVGHV